MRKTELPTGRHNAIVKCQCGNYLVSTGGGRFVQCGTCSGFVDQERWSAMYVRYTTDSELMEQICPINCPYRQGEGADPNHMCNKQFATMGELDKYLKDTYNYNLTY